MENATSQLVPQLVLDMADAHRDREVVKRVEALVRARPDDDFLALNCEPVEAEVRRLFAIPPVDWDAYMKPIFGRT